MRIDTDEELTAYKTLVCDAIISDFSDGEEFIVDTFLDQNMELVKW